MKKDVKAYYVLKFPNQMYRKAGGSCSDPEDATHFCSANEARSHIRTNEQIKMITLIEEDVNNGRAR